MYTNSYVSFSGKKRARRTNSHSRAHRVWCLERHERLLQDSANSMRLLEDSDSPPAGGCFPRKDGHFRPRDVTILRECDLFPRRAASSISVVVAVD